VQNALEIEPQDSVSSTHPRQFNRCGSATVEISPFHSLTP
jgi:hypothetical protein